jgi:glutamate-1-semialdehyde 2,1-aminomutase
VGGTPRYVAHARGSRITDTEGREYVDLVGAWGPMILGHAHPAVVESVTKQAARGSSFGAPTRGEVELAEIVTRMVPSVEMVRMVSSGTEATLSAVRLARGATGRPKLVKFEGCYHGHGDSFLIKAGSGAATFGHPDSPGVTEGTARDTLIAPFNDLEAVRRLFAQNAGAVAAVIVEPVVGNMGVVKPLAGFLEGLRAICTEEGVILIFDEVMTGFRLARGGAQERFGVRPDLTTMGKILGGGLPAAAYGGRRDLMEKIAPAGPIYQAGTLSGNPLAVAAGLTTLRIIDSDPGLYGRLEAKGAALEAGIRADLAKHGYPCVLARCGSMWTLFFTKDEVHDWTGAAKADTARFGRWFRGMLGRGVYTAPSQFEANFLSDAHADADIEATVKASAGALAEAHG